MQYGSKLSMVKLYTEALTKTNTCLADESGWVWFIPLHDGSTSVGVVMDKDIASQKKKQYEADERLESFYLEELKRAPGVIKLVGESRLRTSGDGTRVKMTSDFSYAASNYAGDHYRIAGDAGGN